jgi:uncharacterized protein
MNCRTPRAYNMRMRSPAAANIKCCLLLGLVCAAAAHAQPAPSPQAPLSSIRVTADARLTAKPDRVQIELGVITHAATSQEAAAQNARKADAVLTAVRKALGTGGTLRTISYSLNPDYRYHPNAEPTPDGYTATNVVQATLDDLARIGSVIDTATAAGANRVQGIEFTLRDPDAVRAEALRQAAVRARLEADVLAGALGLKVTRVLSVEENNAQFAPVRLTASRVSAPAAAAVATPVEAGTLDVTANVTLSVEVSPAAR